MLFPTTYHGDEVSEATGSIWLCVARSPAGLTATRCTVSIATVYDEVVEANTGKEVSSPLGDAAFFFVRGVPRLTEGPIPTAFMGRAPIQKSLLWLGHDQRWFIAVRERDGAHRIVLNQRVPGQEQVIAELGSYSEDDGDVPALLWAGDLDGDEKLDLLLDLSDHYIVSEPTLLLSSAAAPGDLVGRVASRRSVGC